MSTDTSIYALATADPGRGQRTHHLDRRAGKIAVEIAAASGDLDELLSTRQLAQLTGLSEQFFEIGRCRNYGPNFTRLSTRRIRYRRSDVLRWLAERVHRSTAEYAGEPGTAAGSPGIGRATGSKVIDGKVVPPVTNGDKDEGGPDAAA
jgi:predicted DNA-binding transcriptional regulator AlpA